MRAKASSPLPWLGGLLALYLLAPILAFVVRLPGGASSTPGVGAALFTSLLTASISTVVVTVTGVPLAYLLARGKGVVARVLTVAVALPLAVPPLMSGLLLLRVVGPYTFVGRLFGGHLTDTRVGIVLAQTFVAAPFLVITARAAFAAVDPALEDMAASLGHGRTARFRLVAVPSALPGIAAGIMLAWLRSFGEFGATVILAYHPYTLPVFTFVQFDAVGLPAVMLPIAASLVAALVVLVLASLRFPRRRRRARATALPPASAPAHPPAPLDFDVATTLGPFSLSVSHAARSPRLAILGASGAGKTLTLRLLAGLASDERSGHVRAGSTALHTLPPERRGIGYVPQHSALLPRRTVCRQVTFGARARPALAAWWIERLGLAGLEDRYPDELSGGERRRVALARALAVEPRVLLLDEPFTGLDSPVRSRLCRELRRLQREAGLSTVVVTHDPEEAALLADEIIVLRDGFVLQAGPRESVFRAPASPEVAALLGIANTHRGVVVAPGLIASGGVELAAPTSDLAAGAEVVWCIRPEHVVFGARGGHAGTISDLIDLGASVEATLSLGPSFDLDLTARTGLPPAAAIGESVLADLPPEHISVWAVPAGSREEERAAGAGRA
jgi:ABC-type sulfate/molybdate transport systems ATPase subunit/ABC-type sulfate transport system permease component